jgi:hypothetical protein
LTYQVLLLEEWLDFALGAGQLLQEFEGQVRSLTKSCQMMPLVG